MKLAFLLLSCLLLGLPSQAQNAGKQGFLDSVNKLQGISPLLHETPLIPSVQFTPAHAFLFQASHRPAILPAGFEATRRLNFLDRIYFGGSNDLVGLRPVAIAQQKMPDPMLQNLYTFYMRSSIGLKKYTRLVLHCEYLLLIKSMSNINYLLPQLGLRQRF